MNLWLNCLCVVFLARSACAFARESSQAKKILFVPLDERFATRGLWLNLARLTESAGYEVDTPPLDIICERKKTANIPKLQSWLDDNMEANTNSVILSLEMLLYGGLIGSRSGNESLAEINERLDWLVSFQQKHKDIPFYISTTVMRIPSYNGDFEEPWYWEYYGRDLYEYSFFLGRFDELGDPADLKAANGYKSMVPSSIVDKFLWRRARNFNITKKVFEFQSDLHLFESLYLTLDDSGEYGLNVNEAIALKKMAHGLNLDKTKVRIYPGADEVESCLLSKMLTAEISKPPLVSILWRAPNATKLIPNYEDQPIEETVRDQIEACGGQVVEGNEADYDILFAVNNFASSPQLEASQQGPPSPKSSRDYQVFDGACDSCGKTLALADVRYSNGGDLAFVEYIKSHINGKDTAPCLTPGRFSYAGWNTDGNTLGTVAANAVILAVLNDNSLTLEENKRFTLLRLLEDVYYQGTGVRDTLIEYIGTTSDDINELNADLPFYEGFSYKPLSLLSEELAKLLDIKFEINPPLAKAYYPWNRTFEIGFELEKMVQDRAQVRKKSPGAKNFSPVQAYCDIIIAGGSTSALAAAFAAADEGPNLSVCLIEPTSWAGGQMTSSLVTALDFGKRNRKLSCMTKNLAKYLQSQKYPFNNPGKCWVSTYCYQAKDMLRNFIMPEIKKRQNLRVYFNTVVSTVTTSSTNEGATIESVVGIFRAAKSNEYLSVPYSAQVEDWFSAEESAMFHKDTITFSSAKSKPIVIDATENGDILVTSGAQYVQGNEYEESSIKTDETCGQAIAFTFYLAEAKIGAESVRGENGHPTNFSLGKYGWDTVWSYRRVSPGISLMAWGSNNGNGNDYPYGYHLLPVEETKKQQPYRGGLNLTTLQQAETYALEFAKWYSSKEPQKEKTSSPTTLVNSSDSIGTLTGLAQLPYIRDTRRSIGVGGFRLNSSHLSGGVRFKDRIALGDYLSFDTHALHDCTPVKFAGPLKPYYIPLRALTNNQFANLLVAGKTMAQTNAANAATRLHPVEWSSGTSSGIFAAFLLENDISTSKVVEECTESDATYCSLQDKIVKYGNPIEWSC